MDDFDSDSDPELVQAEVRDLKGLFDKQQMFIEHFFKNLDHEACNKIAEHITQCKGWVLISGVGKSGSIATLFSDFLVSMGIRSRFLSPVNALHGDIGIVCEQDVFIFISKSGETEELKQIMPFIKNRRAFTISLVCVKDSSLWKMADIGVELPLLRELCPFNMAPATSSILQLIFCSTIAISSMSRTKLSLEMYARNHPGGSIGKRLCLVAKDVMRTDFPRCSGKTPLRDALSEMTICGAVVPVDENQKLIGIFTDGDLRRCLKGVSNNPGSSYESLMLSPISSLITKVPVTSNTSELAYDILKRMQAKKIHQMVVVAEEDPQLVVGIILERELKQYGL